MDPKLRKKVRDTVKQIRREMECDPKLRDQVKRNHLRVLAERGNFNLEEIIAAHDLRWTCSQLSLSCPKLSMIRESCPKQSMTR